MELLERFAEGDLEAFGALFRAHQKEVYAWVVRIVRDTGVAEDLTVETFWRIYNAHRTRDCLSHGRGAQYMRLVERSLRCAALANRKLSLGLYGAALPLLLVPLGYAVTRALNFTIPGIVYHAFPFMFPAALITYYMAWKYLVGFLNREPGNA